MPSYGFSNTIPDMDYIERMARCHMRAGNQSGTWNGSFAISDYKGWFAWVWWPMWELLQPQIGPPPPGFPPPRAICGNGSFVEIPAMLDALGATLSVSRNTNESDFDYFGRLFAV